MRSLVLSCLFTIVVPVVMVYVTPALPGRDRYHLEAGIAMSEYVIHVITRRELYNSYCFHYSVTNFRREVLCSSILGTSETSYMYIVCPTSILKQVPFTWVYEFNGISMGVFSITSHWIAFFIIAWLVSVCG